MSPLTPEELSEMRELVGNPDMTDERFNLLIRFMDAVVIAAIDIHSGRHPVQLSLAEHANTYFQGIPAHARVGTSLEHETVDLDDEGAISTITIGPEGQFSP